MIDLIKRVLADKKNNKEPSGQEEPDAHIALCVLLLEAAHIDGECSNEEKEHVVETLTTRCGIPRMQIDELLASSYKERDDSVDLFRFTRYLNNHYTKKEKLSVMEAVWRVIHVDGRLESHEDHFAHKLANLLRLTHKELIACKIKARQQLT